MDAVDVGPDGEGKAPPLLEGELDPLLPGELELLLLGELLPEEPLLEELLLELDEELLELDEGELDEELLLEGDGGWGVVGVDALGQPASTRQAQLREAGRISLRIPLPT